MKLFFFLQNTSLIIIITPTLFIFCFFQFLFEIACEGFLPWSQGPYLGSFERGETYAHDILQDLNHHAVGWTDWNALLDMKGGPNWAKNEVDAPILLDDDGVTLHKQPM